MDDFAIFGYGSLILPPSVVARFAELPPIDSVYEDGLTLGDDGLVRDVAIREWERRRDGFGIVPVRVRGFRREYSYESVRGGAVLEARYTGDASDMVNGVLMTGFSAVEYEAVCETEVGYGVVELGEDDFEAYGEGEVSFSGSVSVFVAGGDERVIGRGRNRTYHSRILAGIGMVGEMVGEDVGAAFRRDFLEWTYERPVCGGSPCVSALGGSERDAVVDGWMNTVRENDACVAGLEWLFG